MMALSLPDEYIQIIKAPNRRRNAALAITSPSDKFWEK
jgi:hypothetical protein